MISPSDPLQLIVSKAVNEFVLSSLHDHDNANIPHLSTTQNQTDEKISNLTTTLKRFLDLSVFLVQTLSTLLWEWILESVGCVVSSKNVDGSVKGREGWLSSNLWETTVV